MADSRHLRTPTGWRTRRLAPGYALAISFVLALAVGGALHQPPMTTIRFVVGPGTPADALAPRRVEIYPTAQGPLEVDQVQRSEVAIETPEQDFLVCADLPDGVRPSESVIATRGDRLCWLGSAGARTVDITLADVGPAG